MDPFKLATWWVGMCLGIPMLATELATEVWGTKPKPAAVPLPSWKDVMLTNSRIVTADEVERPWRVTDPVVLEPGRIEELPPGSVIKPAMLREIECQAGPFPAPKPRKRKS